MTNRATPVLPYRWQPGQSGNPEGSRLIRRTLGAEIRDATDRGRELIAFYLAVLRGAAVTRLNGRAHRATLDQRMHAAQWLSDRGWGRATEILELVDEAGQAHEGQKLIATLTPEEQLMLRELLDRARTRMTATPIEVTPIDAPQGDVVVEDHDAPGGVSRG